METFVDQWEKLPLFESQKKCPIEVQGKLRALRLSHDPSGLAQALLGLGLSIMPNYRPALKTGCVRIKIINGKWDKKYSDIGNELARGSSFIESIIVPEVGHNVVMEAPGPFAKIVGESLFL